MMIAGVLLASYLLGSIPFSFLITRLVIGKDIRQLGSGNVGATNVLRTTGKLPGIFALIMDVLKGVCAVFLGRAILGSDSWAALAGFAAVVGHSYPLFLGFRGGKSVATGGGAFLVLLPLGILSSIGVFIAMVLTSRIVSLSSIIASASFPLFAWLFGASRGVVIGGALSAAFIIFRHKPNIERLLKGTERRAREKTEAQKNG